METSKTSREKTVSQERERETERERDRERERETERERQRERETERERERDRGLGKDLKLEKMCSAVVVLFVDLQVAAVEVVWEVVPAPFSGPTKLMVGIQELVKC